MAVSMSALTKTPSVRSVTCRCKTMDFSNNGLGLAGIQGLIEALKNNDSLEALNLGTNSIGDEGAEALAAYMAGQSVLCSPGYAAVGWSVQCVFRKLCMGSKELMCRWATNSERGGSGDDSEASGCKGCLAAALRTKEHFQSGAQVPCTTAAALWAVVVHRGDACWQYWAAVRHPKGRHEW